MKRILIAGTHSGCGKTTVTCAVLSALKQRGLDVSTFKCGPDYIDPMFHREASGAASYNLDPFFSTAGQLQERLNISAGDRTAGRFAVIEGVMGYYDGSGAHGCFSTYDVADATDTPVVLVVGAHGASTSLGAVIKGFKTFKDNSRIVGVIFNNAKEQAYELLKAIAEREGVVPLGFMPKVSEFVIESRHLGLKTPSEISDIKDRLFETGRLAEKYIDIDKLIELSAENEYRPRQTSTGQSAARVAVAKDKAFCFMYRENIEMLERSGVQIVYFSPVADSGLPPDINGLYLCGGYPELYLQELSANETMLESVKNAINDGLPTIAECGGFMYLHRKIDGVQMAGAIDGEAFKTDKPGRFGYITLTSEKDNLLCGKGESIRSHEFHYYDSTANGSDFLAQKPFGGRSWRCIHANEALWAGFPHLYFPANPLFAENFVKRCEGYARIYKTAGH
jgi:cobyrinic acid a,c-diamide synthase